MNVLYVDFRAIAHATEDDELVHQALVFAAGGGLVDKNRTKGHFGNPMTIMSIKITNNKQIRDFIHRLKDAGIIRTLIEEVEQRVDDECVFHFRLDKQKAFEEVLVLATGKDVIDCGMKIAAYPAKREDAVKVMIHYFGGITNED